MLTHVSAPCSNERGAASHRCCCRGGRAETRSAQVEETTLLTADEGSEGSNEMIPSSPVALKCAIFLGAMPKSALWRGDPTMSVQSSSASNMHDCSWPEPVCTWQQPTFSAKLNETDLIDMLGVLQLQPWLMSQSDCIMLKSCSLVGVLAPILLLVAIDVSLRYSCWWRWVCSPALCANQSHDGMLGNSSATSTQAAGS